MDEKLKNENMQKEQFSNGDGVGVKWYEGWLVGQADDYHYCYYLFRDTSECTIS